jgi:putative transcriptional regulator
MAHASTHDSLALDHAAGALEPSAILVLNAHARLNARAGQTARLADILGGALLEAMPPATMHATPLPQGVLADMSEEDRAAASSSRSEALIRLAQSDPSSLSWRWRWFGVRDHALPVSGARLLRMKPSAFAPRHAHDAYELTLVLSGRFIDENACYSVGDLAIAGPGDTHRPRTLPTEGCLCLTANVGLNSANMARARLDARPSGYIL